MRKKSASPQPFGRLIAACCILLAVVLVSALMTTFLQKPNLDALADKAATAAPEVDPTLTPEPTITPTPAVYAPFGAQYGYGGANLIPETPTPDPVSVTPTPTAAPTDTPKPTKSPQGRPCGAFQKGRYRSKAKEQQHPDDSIPVGRLGKPRARAVVTPCGCAPARSGRCSPPR